MLRARPAYISYFRRFLLSTPPSTWQRPYSESTPSHTCDTLQALLPCPMAACWSSVTRRLALFFIIPFFLRPTSSPGLLNHSDHSSYDLFVSGHVLSGNLFVLLHPRRLGKAPLAKLSPGVSDAFGCFRRLQQPHTARLLEPAPPSRCHE
jgi:hypothetical protein